MERHHGLEQQRLAGGEALADLRRAQVDRVPEVFVERYSQEKGGDQAPEDLDDDVPQGLQGRDLPADERPIVIAGL